MEAIINEYRLILYIALAGIVLMSAAAVVIWYWATPVAMWFRFLERRYGRLKSGYVAINGVLCHVLHRTPKAPENCTTVLMLHGLGADADHWCLLTAEFGNEMQLLAPDLPGFGDSQLPRQPLHSPQQYAAWLIRLLDDLGIAQCHVLGNSMGGYVAACLARDFPGRVQSLALLAPAGVSTAPHSKIFEDMSEGSPNPLVVTSIADQRRLFQLTTYRRLWLPGTMHRWYARRARKSADHVQACFDSMRFDIEPLQEFVAELTMPCLLVWGEHDNILHPDGLDILSEACNESTPVLLQKTGHLPMLERPVLCASYYQNFLRRNGFTQ